MWNSSNSRLDYKDEDFDHVIGKIKSILNDKEDEVVFFKH